MRLLLFFLVMACGQQNTGKVLRVAKVGSAKIQELALLGAHTKSVFKKTQAITAKLYKQGKPYKPVHDRYTRERVYPHPGSRGITSKKIKHLYNAHSELLEVLNRNVSLMKNLPQEMDIKQRANFFARLNPQIGIYELTRKMNLLDIYLDFPNKGGRDLGDLLDGYSQYKNTALDQIFIEDGQPKQQLLDTLEKKILKKDKKATKKFKKLVHSVLDDIEKVGGIKAFAGCCKDLMDTGMGGDLFGRISEVFYKLEERKQLSLSLKALEAEYDRVFWSIMDFN